MKLWTSSESDRFAQPAVQATRTLVKPLLAAAWSRGPLADLDVTIRHVPIVMDEEGRGRYPARSRTRKNQNLYDCAPQLDYPTFQRGRPESQIAEYLRGLEECAAALPKLGASPAQVGAFLETLVAARHELTAPVDQERQEQGRQPAPDGSDAGRGLSAFERRMLTFVLSIEAPDLLDQVPTLMVVKRDVTGVGLFVDFEAAADPDASDLPLRSLGSLAFATKEGWEDLIRCVIAVRGGQIVGAEFFANSLNEFPENLDDAKFGHMGQPTALAQA